SYVVPSDDFCKGARLRRRPLQKPFLTSLKFGWALFHEGTDSFEAIVRMKTFKLGLDFAFERFHQCVFFAGEDGLLHGADSDLRAFGDFFGEGGDSGFKLIGGKKMVKDAKAMRGLRIDHFT